MAIIDRDTDLLSVEERDNFDEIAAAHAVSARSAPEWSVPGRVLLAAVSAGAGAIHLVMVPSHANEWMAEGIAFAVAGWMQLIVACWVMVRPSKPLLRIACAATAVFIAAWLVSRMWGFPVGPEAGVAHPVSFVDEACVALEVLFVVAGLVLAARPNVAGRLGSAPKAVLSIVPAAALVLATAAIASPSALNHAHAGDAAHDHSDGAAAAPAVHDHDHPAAPADDKGLSLIMNGAGEGGGHVHDHSIVPVDAQTQAALDAQLAKMKPLIDKYPTVKDAEAAGYTRQGPYSPALGVHYGGGGEHKGAVNLGPTMSDEALLSPMLIYDGVSPDSKLAGFMYNIFSLDKQNAPEGFVGPNDHWHYHSNVCIVPRPGGGTDAPLGADASVDKALCDKYGGIIIENTGYMVHVWPVPGYESSQGLFSNLNPKLTCPNGTYYTIPLEEIGNRKNVCRDVTE